MKRKRKEIIIILLLALCTILLFCRILDDSTDMDGVKWDGRKINQEVVEPKYIDLPGFDKVRFDEGQINQKVNIFNPSTNDCYMKFILYIDDEIIWQSDNVYPGYGFYNIQITKPLDHGNYTAYMEIRCFDIESDKELNGGIFTFVITV